MTTASATSSPSLLARVAAAFAAWLPARRARLARPRPVGAAGASAQWTQLARQATQFFDARGLAPEYPAQPWPEAGNRLLRKGPRRYLVHAAHWQAARVDAATVQAVLRAVAQQRATAGIVLCARDVFTPAARALARENAILLLEPSQLRPAPPRESTAPVAPVPAASAMRPAPATVATPTTTTPRPAPAAARRPVLRPDDEVRGRRDFMPTVPFTPDEVAAPGGAG